MILKNYNDGRHGGWNNYCCYNKTNTGTFVKKHGQKDIKAQQHQVNVTAEAKKVVDKVSEGLLSQIDSKSKKSSPYKMSNVFWMIINNNSNIIQ